MYTKYSLTLTDGQVKKLSSAIKNEKGITIRLKKIQKGNIPLLLTQTQINHLDKKAKANKGADLKLSHAQVSAMKKDGGILPLLLAAIPALITAGKAAAAATALGAAGGLGKLAVDKISGRGLRLGPSKKGKGLRFKKI